MSKHAKVLAKLADNKNLMGLSEKLRRYDTKKAARVWYGLEGASKIETVVHGDFWSNNMMFSVDSDGKPTGVKARKRSHKVSFKITRSLTTFSHTDTRLPDGCYKPTNRRHLLFPVRQYRQGIPEEAPKGLP